MVGAAPTIALSLSCRLVRSSLSRPSDSCLPTTVFGFLVSLSRLFSVPVVALLSPVLPNQRLPSSAVGSLNPTASPVWCWTSGSLLITMSRLNARPPAFPLGRRSFGPLPELYSLLLSPSLLFVRQIGLTGFIGCYGLLSQSVLCAAYYL